jgi:hypothetical protein
VGKPNSVGALAEPTEGDPPLLRGELGGRAWVWRGVQSRVAVAAVVCDPSSDRADVDAEEAGDFNLRVAIIRRG